MISEVLPGAYDTDGVPIPRPSKKHHRWFAPHASLTAYLLSPSTVACESLDDVRAFLSRCRYVSDEEQFGLPDFWMTPAEFESSRRGDCEDFALWSWVKLLTLGYDARFVCGRAGRYGAAHAWVTYKVQNRVYLLEPQLAVLAASFPRLSTLRYEPDLSVAWDSAKLHFFTHSHMSVSTPVLTLATLVPEWACFWPSAISRAVGRRIRSHRHEPAGT